VSDPDVSVIVPVRNAAGRLPTLLAALDEQTLPRERFEIIVADDASTDATADLAEARSGVQVVRLATQGGSYAARNAALETARGGVLAFTDGDCRPQPDWLERGLAEVEGGADLAAGHVELPLGERPTTGELIDVARHLHQERNVDAGFGATANLFVRAAVLDRIGPFNASLMSGGDLEFGLRAREAGFRLVYAPAAVVVHPPRRARELIAKSLRLGFARARRGVHGHEVSRPPTRALWTHPGAWVPGTLLRGTAIHGMDRLERTGRRFGRLDRIRLALGEWAFVQLPLTIGDLGGRLRVRRRR
jgi:glycosyltransferase involved in cell wall biosynthesis